MIDIPSPCMVMSDMSVDNDPFFAMPRDVEGSMTAPPPLWLQLCLWVDGLVYTVYITSLYWETILLLFWVIKYGFEKLF